MTIRHIAKGLLFGASLLLATATFAGEKAIVKVYEDVKVNGTTLSPGSCELTWEGTGSHVQASIRQGGNPVATVPASVETSKIAAISTGYSTKSESDGSKEITNVFFAGKKVSLNLEEQAGAQSAANPGNK